MVIGITFLLAILSAGVYFYPQLAIATGYAAKKVCTCTYATGRDLEEVERNDLYFNILTKVDNKLNKADYSVTSTLFGLSPQTAKFKPGIGCILLDGKDDYNVTFPIATVSKVQIDSAFKAVDIATVDVDRARLQNAVNEAFDTNDALNHKRTTAVVIIHRDTLIAEKYAKPFDKETPQLGWSMTKSMMNTFAAILIHQGKLKAEQNNLFTSWANDDRKKISVTNLLQMNSGLSWEEDYATVSDATKMLYRSEDVAAIPLSKTLQFEIGKKWYYSSGTTNLLSKYFRNMLADDKMYLTFLKQNLFDVLGMHSAFIETDETGTFIGSSYGYATPRDWAKYGMLYLHDGVWQGKRLLPEGWVAFSKAAAEGSNGIYGAQFWLNQKGIQYPDAPHDMFIADGFQGQSVFIIPSHDLVIVRMGTGGDHFDTNLFLKNILASIPKKTK
jgi:CubicO group peptidase (beta-lactamase class C family)